MDLAEKVEAIQQASYEKIKKGSYKGYPFLRLLYEAYEELYNLPCKHCASHINKYISRIKNHDRNYKVMEDSNYKLKKNARIRYKNKPYTNSNLTDEVAEAFIKINPNRKQLFVEVPKKNDNLDSEKEELTLTEFREKHPDIKARSKEDFLEK